jgi:hypothetical protein
MSSMKHIDAIHHKRMLSEFQVEVNERKCLDYRCLGIKIIKRF